MAKLRRRAAQRGVSLEEEHRQILRAAVLPEVGGRAVTFKEYLLKMPPGGEESAFERPPAKLRRVRL